MKVNFISRGGPHLASYRLRIEAPGRELERLGFGVVVGSYDPSADVHVFSKHWGKDGDYWGAVESPCPVFDLCDDWFGREHDEHYRRMCSVCSVVVSSRRLGERVLEETGKTATYIPEPYELPEGEVKEPGANPKVLWFGHSSNLVHLRGLSIPNLLVCTNAVGKGIVPYSPENLARCLEYCDLVVIPQVKDWKSANRLVESLRAGRFVVASDIPSYRGFDQYLGDIEEGLDWVRQNAGSITQRIISGRRGLTSFTPEAVGREWSNFISAAVKTSSGVTGTLTPSVPRISTGT